MDVAGHVERLVWQKQGESSRGSLSEVVDLQKALKAFNPASSDEAEDVQPIAILEGVDYSRSKSIWDDVCQIASSSGRPASLNEQHAESHSSIVTSRLFNHLHSISQGDEALYNSILSEVQSCLEREGASDDQIFDQLDLVTDLVREKKQVCKDLRSKVSIKSERSKYLD
jgi:hypothetical protein